MKNAECVRTDEDWFKIAIQGREKYLSLTLKDQNSTYFAYAAISLTGPHFDKDTQIHKMRSGKVIKLNWIDASHVYVKYPLETYILLEMRYKEEGPLV